MHADVHEIRERRTRVCVCVWSVSCAQPPAAGSFAERGVPGNCWSRAPAPARCQCVPAGGSAMRGDQLTLAAAEDLGMVSVRWLACASEATSQGLQTYPVRY